MNVGMTRAMIVGMVGDMGGDASDVGCVGDDACDGGCHGG